MRLLNENPVRLYLLALLSAAAWLAKSSTTLLPGTVCNLSFGRLIMNQFLDRACPGTFLRRPGARDDWLSVSPFLSRFTLRSSLLGSFTRTRHGAAFYSLPSFWFWADDWETWVKDADCRKVRLAELPVEEQPTMTGYFHRHDIGDAFLATSERRQRSPPPVVSSRRQVAAVG
jgi:hypothetical protein